MTRLLEAGGLAEYLKRQFGDGAKTVSQDLKNP
jgi:hypothetical protein